MTEASVQQADLALIRTLLEWAANEGWNPGLDDAALFHAIDPTGFFVLSLDRQPIAGLSLVRHDARHAFLGLYICHPAYRGRGHGWRLWQAGLAASKQPVIGLDGVVEQQANYRASGFETAYRNIRHAGRASGVAALGASVDDEFCCRPAVPDDLPAMQSFDTRVHGHERLELVRQWSHMQVSRHTWVVDSPAGLRGHATLRRCIDGFKVGPLLARDSKVAALLLARLAEQAGSESMILDVPEPNTAGMKLAATAGLQPVFETARMYRGPAPVPRLQYLYGVTSFELG